MFDAQIIDISYKVFGLISEFDHILRRYFVDFAFISTLNSILLNISHFLSIQYISYTVIVLMMYQISICDVSKHFKHVAAMLQVI